MFSGMHTQNITAGSNAILRRLWRIKKLGHREKNDVCPEHNAGMTVIPQILTNHAEDFLAIAEILREYGYDTVNLNLGCRRARWRQEDAAPDFLCDAGRAGSFSGRDF